MANGVWTTDLSEIKQEATKFFNEKYREGWPNRPLFRSIGFHKLSETDACFFEGVFSIEEIKNAVFVMWWG